MSGMHRFRPPGPGYAVLVSGEWSLPLVKTRQGVLRCAYPGCENEPQPGAAQGAEPGYCGLPDPVTGQPHTALTAFRRRQLLDRAREDAARDQAGLRSAFEARIAAAEDARAALQARAEHAEAELQRARAKGDKAAGQAALGQPAGATRRRRSPGT